MNLFPLTTDQTDLIRYAGSAPASLLNLAVYVEIEDKIDESLFIKAINLSAERLTYTRCRLHKKPDGSIEQYISEMDEQYIPQWKDYSNWSDKKINKQLSKWASKAFPNKQKDVQLYHIELMRLKDGKHGFFFCGHHLVMDIYAVTYFVTYIDNVYYALSNNLELPKCGGDVEKIAKQRVAYIGSEKYKKDYEFWKKAYAEEPNFTSFNGVGARETIKGKQYGRDRSLLQIRAKEKVYTLTHELENLINEKCLKMNISASMAYCLALRTFLATVCETDKASIQITISYRPNLEAKTTGLTRASSIGLVTDVTSNMTFEEALKETYKTDCNYLKHMEYPATYVQKDMHHVPGKCCYQTTVFSYVPYLDFDKIHLNVKAKKIDSGFSLKPSYILAMHLAKGQPISIIYQYSTGYYKEKVIDKCENFLEKFLEKGFNNPQMKIGDIAKECI